MVSGIMVSGIVLAGVNAFASFLVAPDGSNDGWDMSNAFDNVRADFCAWLRNRALIIFVEVGYGEAPDGAPRRRSPQK